MVTYENPSAGKFEPPPNPEWPKPTRSPTRWLTTVLMIVSAYPVIHWLDSFADGRRWLPFLTGGAAFASGVLHYVLHRKRTDAIDGKDPFSPPTSITR